MSSRSGLLPRIERAKSSDEDKTETLRLCIPTVAGFSQLFLYANQVTTSSCETTGSRCVSAERGSVVRARNFFFGALRVKPDLQSDCNYRSSSLVYSSLDIATLELNSVIMLASSTGDAPSRVLISSSDDRSR